MDQVKTGNFLSCLRKEKGLTQEQLGEILGISNKTISRWETGSYMPPVEMLQELSRFYNVSINEILSGERLTNDTYMKKAEENIAEALEASSFTLKEKTVYFKNKWRKEHIGVMILSVAAWAGIIFILKWQHVDAFVMGGLAGFLAATIYGILNNRMMIYVEKNIYGDRKQ